MKTKVLIPTILSSLFILHSAFGQGALAPSAPPGPTMVTLSQIEPRTPISSAPYTITQPGSYYLTTNLTVSSGNAIFIAVNNVTLDLGGFTISSTAASATGTAIYLNNLNALTNIDIYNGQISSGVTNSPSGSFGGGGFLNGIYAADTPYNARVKNVSVAGVMDSGIYLGNNVSIASTLVESCVVNVAGSYGIAANMVSDSVALGAGNYGISCDTANNCYASGYGTATGISANNAENCYGTSSGGEGISTLVAENCYGYGGGDDAGIDAFATENCYGSSLNGNGLDAETAENCYGYSDGSSGIGLNATYVANACSGYNSNSGTGLNAWLANACVGIPTLTTTHNVNSFEY